MRLIRLPGSVERDLSRIANCIEPALWRRSRRQPVRLSEIVQAVVILAFAFAMPILAAPTLAVLLIVLLERIGLTLLGKIVALLAIGAMIFLALITIGYVNGL